jgi:Glycosyl transferase family 2
VSFVLGVPRCNEPAPLFAETLHAVRASSVLPAYTVIVDNGDDRFAESGSDCVVVRPSGNVGRAAAWNIVLRLAFETLTIGRAILLDGDCAVAPDTFERVLAAPTGVVCAAGFSCFRLDEAPWRAVGEFDEEFWPASFEGADYRRRLALAGVPVEEWPLEEHARPARGRVTYESGITLGRADPLQGWSARKIARLQDQLAANRTRYIVKWGGPPGQETLSAPFLF